MKDNLIFSHIIKIYLHQPQNDKIIMKENSSGCQVLTVGRENIMKGIFVEMDSFVSFFVVIVT